MIVYLSAAGRRNYGFEAGLLPDDVPDAFLAIAYHVALLLVGRVEVNRSAVIGPLHLAVFALHQCPVPVHHPARLAEIGRPEIGAEAIAARYAAFVFVENIQCHAVFGCEHAGVGANG